MKNGREAELSEKLKVRSFLRQDKNEKCRNAKIIHQFIIDHLPLIIY